MNEGALPATPALSTESHWHSLTGHSSDSTPLNHSSHPPSQRSAMTRGVAKAFLYNPTGNPILSAFPSPESRVWRHCAIVM